MATRWGARLQWEGDISAWDPSHDGEVEPGKKPRITFCELCFVPRCAKTWFHGWTTLTASAFSGSGDIQEVWAGLSQAGKAEFHSHVYQIYALQAFSATFKTQSQIGFGDSRLTKSFKIPKVAVPRNVQV